LDQEARQDLKPHPGFFFEDSVDAELGVAKNTESGRDDVTESRRRLADLEVDEGGVLRVADQAKEDEDAE
jgi:hypothetical protein